MTDTKYRIRNAEEYEAAATVAKSTAAAHRRMPPTERQVQALRWIWMRGNLTVADLPALNWINIGGLVCRGLLAVPEHPAAKLHVTSLGVAYVLGKIAHLHDHRRRRRAHARQK